MRGAFLRDEHPSELRAGIFMEGIYIYICVCIYVCVYIYVYICTEGAAGRRGAAVTVTEAAERCHHVPVGFYSTHRPEKHEFGRLGQTS